MNLIQEGGIGAYAAIALGLLGSLIGALAVVALLGKNRSAFSLGIATLIVSAATSGAGMLGTVYGRMQVTRAVSFVGSSVDMERILRMGFREAQSSSWVGLFAAILPLVLGVIAALGGSRLQQARGPTQGFGGPVVSSDDGLGGQSMMAIIVAVISVLAGGGAWAVAHSELPKLRYPFDENDSDSWGLVSALESLEKGERSEGCQRLARALDPFWGATNLNEWPRTMRRTVPTELTWRPGADACAKAILSSLGNPDANPGLAREWTQSRLLESPLLQDDTIHTLALAWAPKPAENDPGDTKVGQGSLAREAIVKTLRSDLKGIQRCYELELKRTPSLNGKLVVQFTIGSSGKVVSAEEDKAGAFPSAKVTDCVLGRFKMLRFPAPSGGGVVRVKYPFVFQSAE